jgi:hypothetical protein
VVAVAHSILEAIHHMLRSRSPHRDLGVDHFEKLQGESYQRWLVRKLEQRGYKVILEPAAA